MELFIDADTTNDAMSLAIQFFANYVRAPQRNIVNMNALTAAALSSLKLDKVSETAPTLYLAVGSRPYETGYRYD